MKRFTMCTLVLLGVVLFVACGGSNNNNDINNDTDYELYEPEVYGAEENDNDVDNDTETTSNQTLPPVVQTPAVTPQEPNDEVPFLWLVTAPHGQTMYIFGSTHVGTADLYPLSPVIMDAFGRSDYLAVEVWESEGSANPPPFLLAYGQAITDYIPEELYQRAIAVFMEYESYLLHLMGMSAEAMDNIHPIMWWQLLTYMTAEKLNLHLEYGLESFFIREASALGMEILSIEDGDELIKALMGMSPPLLTALIEASLDVNLSVVELELQYELWRSGDDKGLLAQSNFYEFLSDEELAQEFRYVMLTQRDIQMADRASEFMNEGKSVFFMVGAMHLIGEGSVIELLERRGYGVERIR